LSRKAASGAAGSALLALLSGCGSGPEATPPDPAALLHEDPRIQVLIGPCPQGGFYDRDLSDPAGLLVAKIERARPDPMKRAKEELGLLEERAFPALARAYHTVYADMMRSAYLENLVDALAFNPSDEAHELLLEALQHPQESVRSKALEGLSRRARPEDFDLLVQRLAIETRDLRRLSVAALFQADRVRAEAFFLEAVARDEEGDLWVLALPRLSESRSPASAARCATLYTRLEPPLTAHLAAAAARAGDAEALEFLRGELRSEDGGRLLSAITAAERAGLIDELGEVLQQAASPEARAIAASAVARAEPTDTHLGWLRAALSDSAQTVRTEALIGLCRGRDGEGLTLALAQLQGQPVEMQESLQALRTPMREDAEIARRVLDVLVERHSLEEHRPLGQRTPTFKAIGQVPLREAAEFLRRIGVEAGDEHIESLRAHEWLMIQASNTDPIGRKALADALATEADPLRRIDLLDAVGSQRDSLAREFLLAHAEDPQHAPLERLFASSVLLKIGPSWEIAPRLKRIAFGMQGPEFVEARAALQCLLWTWY